MGKFEFTEGPNDPFCWIEVVPFNPIAVVIRKGVVIVMVSFPKGEKTDGIIIDGGMFLAKLLCSPGMGKRVDKPGKVVEEKEADSPGDHKGSKVVAQNIAHRKSHQDVSEDHKEAVVLMLEHDQFIAVEVCYDFLIDRFSMAKEPEYMSVHKPFLDGVRITIGIDKGMVSPVIARPL